MATVDAIVVEVSHQEEGPRQHQSPTHSHQSRLPENVHQRIGQAQRIARLGYHLTGLVASGLALGLMIAERRSSRLQKPAEARAHDPQAWFREMVAGANLVRNPAYSEYLQGLVVESSQRAYDLGSAIAEAGERVRSAED